MHTWKYNIIDYRYKYMDLKCNNRLEQYTVEIIIVGGRKIRMVLGMIFQQNVSFIYICLSHVCTYVCIYVYMSNISINFKILTNVKNLKALTYVYIITV